MQLNIDLCVWRLQIKKTKQIFDSIQQFSEFLPNYEILS